MSGQIIDFAVTDIDRKIVQGSLDKLYQKNNSGFYVSADDSATITLTLTMQSFIRHIQIKILHVQKLIVQLLTQTMEPFEKIDRFNNESQKTYLINFQRITKLTKHIRITFGSVSHPAIGIKFIIVKGDRFNNKTASNIKNKKEIFFDEPKKSPHAILSKTSNLAMFSDRKKHKQTQKQVIGIEKQDDELKRVLQISRKQAQREQKDRKYGNSSKKQQKRQNYMVLQQETIVIESQAVKQYAKVNYDTVKDIFTFVNPKWLQAQKKAQIAMGVKLGERLSERLRIKHFFNKSIVIDINISSKKQQLAHLALQMGAKIITQLKQHCILVTNRTDTQKVSKARKFGNIAIVNTQFIEQCHQCDALLNIKDYYLKL